MTIVVCRMLFEERDTAVIIVRRRNLPIKRSSILNRIISGSLRCDECRQVWSGAFSQELLIVGKGMTCHCTQSPLCITRASYVLSVVVSINLSKWLRWEQSWFLSLLFVVGGANHCERWAERLLLTVSLVMLHGAGTHIQYPYCAPTSHRHDWAKAISKVLGPSNARNTPLVSSELER
jgi:hypothetical protein